MNHRPLATHTALVLATLVLTAGCAGKPGGGTGDGGSSLPAFADASVIAAFADNVAVPTYALLERRVVDLKTALADLATQPDDTHLAAAKAAWAAAHQAWALSEAFALVPPSPGQGIADIDTWPVDTAGIDALLAGTDPITGATVAGLAPNQIGLHAIAYVLFGADSRSTAADLTQRKLDLLGALADALATSTQAAASAWTDSGGYRDQLANAGQSGDAAFTTVTAAAAAIVTAMGQEAGAVGATKIAAPQATHDPTRVEGRFSASSVDGFVANVQGIQAAYLGAVPAAGTSGAGLTGWVSANDPSLDGQIKAAFQNTLDAVGRLPQPFTDAISNPASSGDIETAAAQAEDLQSLLDKRLLPLIQGG